MLESRAPGAPPQSIEPKSAPLRRASGAETPRGSDESIERVAGIGSCVRCGRALGLASAKVDGRWYGNAVCATGAPCPYDRREPAVPEPWLYARPRRYFRKRLPKELRAAG